MFFPSTFGFLLLNGFCVSVLIFFPYICGLISTVISWHAQTSISKHGHLCIVQHSTFCPQYLNRSVFLKFSLISIRLHKILHIFVFRISFCLAISSKHQYLTMCSLMYHETSKYLNLFFVFLYSHLMHDSFLQ